MTQSPASTERKGLALAPARRGAVRRRARRLDRQRRAAVDRPRPRLLPGRTCPGSSTPTRSSSAASCCSAGAWPTCSAAAACSSSASILFAVASLLGGLSPERGLADRRPRRPGPRRRAALARRAVDPHHDLRRGRGAQQGARRLGRRGRLRRRRRRAARRHADRVGRLGVGAVRQRADRAVRRRAGLAPAAREPRRAGARHFDVAGAVTVTAGLSLLVYALVDANNAGWGSTQTLGLIAIALALIAAFVAIELRTSHPLVPFADLPQAHADAAPTSSRCSSRCRCSRCSSSSRSTCSRCSATTR